MGRGVSGSGLALLVAGWSAGCQVARTEVVVRVESELAWGEGASLQSVVLTVRRGGATGPIRSERTTALGRSAGRSALPMHVGVLETSDDRDTPLWLEARGCAGPNGCSAEEAVVVQRAVVRFVPESRVLVTLLLASACVGVRCGVEELCVPTTGRCRPADEATTVVGTGAWPDAGRGVEDRVNVLDAGRTDDATVSHDAADDCGRMPCLHSCPQDFGDCDRDPSNGCEIDLRLSQEHCGACGAVCPASTSCTLGRCATSGFAGYRVGTAPSEVQWIEACTMSGRQNVMVGADDGFFSGTLPFPVQFWGAWHQEWVVTSNGQVSFGSLFHGLNAMPSQAPFNSFGPLPIPAVMPLRGMWPAVYAFGVDLILGDEGVCVATDGAPPDRRWVAETRNARSFSTANTAFTFELIAYEGQTYLDVLYSTPWAAPVGTPASGNEITLGTQDFRQPVRAVAYTGPVGPGIRLRYTPR